MFTLTPLGCGLQAGAAALMDARTAYACSVSIQGIVWHSAGLDSAPMTMARPQGSAPISAGSMIRSLVWLDVRDGPMPRLEDW